MHRQQVDLVGAQALEGLLDLFDPGRAAAVAQAYLGSQEQGVAGLELIDEFTHHGFSCAIARRAVDHLPAQLLKALNRGLERRFFVSRLNLLVTSGGADADYGNALAGGGNFLLQQGGRLSEQAVCRQCQRCSCSNPGLEKITTADSHYNLLICDSSYGGNLRSIREQVASELLTIYKLVGNTWP